MSWSAVTAAFSFFASKVGRDGRTSAASHLSYILCLTSIHALATRSPSALNQFKTGYVSIILQQ